MRNRRVSTAAHLAAGFVIVLGLAGCGCGHSAPDGDKDAEGMTKEQSKSGDRMEGIIKKSDGNFDKIEPADKAWLINSMAGGNEQAARAMFGARTGHPPSGGPGSAAPKPGPGGPPPPGGGPGPVGGRPIGGPGASR